MTLPQLASGLWPIGSERSAQARPVLPVRPSLIAFGDTETLRSAPISALKRAGLGLCNRTGL